MKSKLYSLLNQINELLENKENAAKLPDNTFYMGNDLILTGVRRKGVSRYPYSRDGLVVWASHNGYITANESDFVVFRPSYTDEMPCLGFFMGVPHNGGFYPISVSEANSQLYTPVNVTRYTVYSPEAAYYIADTDDLAFCVRLFVGKDKKINFTLSAVNKSGTEQKIYLSYYYQALLRFEEIETFWSKGDRDVRMLENGNFILHNSHQTENYMVLNSRIKGNATANYGTTSLRDFAGTSGRPAFSGLSLKNGRFERCEPVTKGTEMPIAGSIVHFTLQPDEEALIDHSFTITRDESEALLLANNTALPCGNFESEIEELEKQELKSVESLNISFNDWHGKLDPKVLTKFLRTVQRQTAFCAFGKCYAGPYLGVRDVFQQLEGALIWNPETARKQIIKAFGYLDPSGRAPRQFTIPPVDSIMPSIDSRQFIDQGVWMIDTVYTYLAYTEDYSILDEICGYYILPPTANYDLAEPCDKKDSLLNHMTLIIEFLLGNLDREFGTNCLRILHGDWNDAIDGLGKPIDNRARFGSGVSVMATLQLYRCLNEMSEILAKLGNYSDNIEKYADAKNEIREGFFKYAVQTAENGEKRLVHGWGDKLSYYLGSFKDSDGENRISFASNAFYAISGLINDDDSLKSTAVEALKSLDSRFGLMTLKPAFRPDSYGVGRIANTLEGTAENACAYVHASLFSICALFAMGESEYAWKQLETSMVISHGEPSLSTFAMPNSYLDNPKYNYNGDSAGDWFTGAGAVLIKGIIKYGFGIKPNLDGLKIEMPLCMPTNGVSIEIVVKGEPIKICYKNNGIGVRKYLVNGAEAKTEINPINNTPYILLGKTELKGAAIEVID